jgi:hypothetical protein
MITEYKDWEITVKDAPWLLGYSCVCRYHFTRWICFLTKYDQLGENPEQQVTEIGKQEIDGCTRTNI